MAGKRKGGKNSKRANRPRGSSTQSVTITRTMLLGSVPAGNGTFEGSTILPVYPDQSTIGPIAQQYSEYKFSRFTVSLIPRCSTSTLGTKFVGMSYGLPMAFSTLAQVYALQRVSITSAYGRVGVSNLVASNASQRWYPVVQGNLSPSQTLDPNIVQAYAYMGSQGVQSGVVPADIKVSYTVTLRGPVGATGATFSASGLSFTRSLATEAPASGAIASSSSHRSRV